MIAVSASSESPINRTTDHITTQQSGGETSRAAEKKSSRAGGEQQQDAPSVCSTCLRCRHPLVCDAGTIFSWKLDDDVQAGLVSHLGGTIPTSGGDETKRPKRHRISLSLSIAFINSGAMRKKEDVCIFRTRDFQKQANLT